MLRTRLSFASLLVVAVLAVSAFARPERFHTRLLKSNPTKDTTLVAAPAQLELWFSEKIDLKVSRVQLVDAAQKPVATSALTQDATKADAPVVAKVTGAMAPGVYTVNWSAASGDGHPVKGSFGFTIGTK